MGTQLDTINQLLVTSLKDLGWGKYTDYACDLQEYVAMPRLLKKEVKTYGGAAMKVNLMKDDNGAAQDVDLFDTDDANYADIMTNGEVPFRHTKTSWAIEEHFVTANAGDMHQIIDEVQIQEEAAMNSLAKKLETSFWSKPATSADTRTPWGIYMYIVKNNGATAAFQGGNPAGFTSGAVFDSTTITQWDNWAGGYTDVTKTDLIAKIRTACYKTKFKSPINKDHRDKNGMDRYEIFCNYATRQAFENVGEAQNENLGRDLAPYDDDIVIRRYPIYAVPQLDSDTTNPVLGINWAVLFFGVMKGWNMKKTGPRKSATKRNVREVHYDLSHNLKCTDRRRLWCFSV